MSRPSHKFVTYFLITVLVVIGFSIAIMVKRLQSPEAMQSSSFAQESPPQGEVCAPINSLKSCFGARAYWEKGDTHTCLSKGGVPIGGDCDHVCCVKEWSTRYVEDTCNGLGKEKCESFNSCPFNYSCAWDESMGRCSSNPSKVKKIACTPSATPSPIPSVIPSTTPTPAQCGNGMTYTECTKDQRISQTAWYRCACEINGIPQGGCFPADVDPRVFCPKDFPAGYDICQGVTICEERPTYCQRSKCGQCYMKGQPEPICPSPTPSVGPAYNTGGIRSAAPTSSSVQNPGAQYYQGNPAQ